MNANSKPKIKNFRFDPNAQMVLQKTNNNNNIMLNRYSIIFLSIDVCGDGEEYKLLINDTYRGWGCGGGWGDDAVIYIYVYSGCVSGTLSLACQMGDFPSRTRV